MKTILGSMKLAFFYINLKVQNVNIHNTNFKAYFIHDSSINNNWDTEIKVSQAAFIDSILVGNQNVFNLWGIFTIDYNSSKGNLVKEPISGLKFITQFITK